MVAWLFMPHFFLQTPPLPLSVTHFLVSLLPLLVAALGFWTVHLTSEDPDSLSPKMSRALELIFGVGRANNRAGLKEVRQRSEGMVWGSGSGSVWVRISSLFEGLPSDTLNLVRNKVLLYNPGWPGTHYIQQDSLELMGHSPPPKCWDHRCALTK